MSRLERRAARSRGRRRSFLGFLAAVAVATAAVAAWRLDLFGGGSDPERASGRERDIPPSGPSPLSPPDSGALSVPNPYPPAEPINSSFEGLTTFRGNATRTYYGEGPVPENPEIRWRFPGSGGLCSQSTDKGVTKTWCGTGWTGQPNVVETEQGRTEVRFGAYDRAVHVLNARNAREVKAPFVTGDIIKGTVTSDPDGYPLLYSGSRDNFFRIFALDRGGSLVELWKIHADSAPNRLWNDDWDSSALVIEDHLLVGGENSWFYVVKLNRGQDDRGKVTVDPEVRAIIPGFDDELLSALGDTQVSIENSPAFRDGVVYFANSGGLVQGWDISDLLDGGTEYERVFRFWTGEDTDASVVIDDEGFLYVSSELERNTARGAEVGQFLKLDPGKPSEPVVWSIPLPGAGGAGGAWATPGLYKRAVFVTTNTGRLLAVNRDNGRIKWEVKLPPPTWTSPVIVDGALLVGDCAGYLHAYDVRHPLDGPPQELWSLKLEGCIESTPAVWKGWVYVGARGGAVYGIADR